MPSRRSVLGAVGAGAVAATGGCSAVSRLVGPLESHVLHDEAPVDDPNGPWPTDAADPGRTGAVADATAPAPDALVHEVTTLGLYADTQPVVESERAFLGVDRRPTDGEEFSGLVAFDLAARRPDERVDWRRAAGGPTAAFTPAVRGRVVYAQLGDGVMALDAATGEVYWRTTDGGTTPTVDGDDCFTAGDGVVALDAVTGETRWTSETPESAPSGLAVAEGVVCLACGDGGEGALWAFDRADGSTRWRYPALGESYATAVTDGERAYAVSTDGVAHAVGLDDGERRWTRAVDGQSYVQPAVADGTVYLTGSNSEAVRALDAATGEVIWRRSVGIGGCSAPAVTADAAVFVTSTQTGVGLLVLDRGDGAERARFELPRGMNDRIQPVVGDGVAYAVTEPARATQSHLYAVR